MLIPDIDTLHVLVAEVGHFHTVNRLFASNADRRTIGEFVLGVECCELRVVMDGVVLGGSIAEVNGLAGASSGEEGGVAGSGGLSDLVAHGEEVNAEFARLRVWFHNDALLLIVNLCHTYILFPILPINHMRHGKFQGVLGQIARYADNIADIVAFQFEHQTQVVAQVVGGETESQGQVALVEATSHTAGKAHLGLVPQTHAIQRHVERQQAVVVDADETISGEMVPRLDDLQGESATLGHTELEIAAGIGLHRRAYQAHEIPVEQEIGVAHRDTAVLIEHTPREAHSGDVVKVNTGSDATS